MAIEYEVRILEVSVDDMIARLECLGIQKKGVFHQKRYVYDFKKGTLNTLRTPLLY